METIEKTQVQQRKIVYVWGAKIDPFREDTVPTYTTEPPLRGHIVGTGAANMIASHVQEVIAQGYEMVLDKNRHGENFPLSDNDRRAFTSLINRRGRR